MESSQGTRGLTGLCQIRAGVASDPIRELAAAEGIVVRLLDSGAVHSILAPDVPVTLLAGNRCEGSPANVYLRVPEAERGAATSATAPASRGSAGDWPLRRR